MPEKRGRPPLAADDASVTITLRVPSKQYARVVAQAQRERLTVSELIRRSLRVRDEFRFLK
jgi:hypothetical protein